MVEPLGEKLGGYVGEKIGDAIIADKEDKFGTILTPPRNYKKSIGGYVMRIIMQSVFLYIWVFFVFVITSFAMPKPGID